MPTSPVEVELKFPVDSLDPIRSQLLILDAQSMGTFQQTDEYFNDPLRDFAQSDQALRLRRVGEQFWLTFKGPNLDDQAKIRTELETPLDEQAAAMIRSTFLEIGFFSVAKVVKERETMKLNWGGNSLEVCLDQVAEVGCFVELEKVVADGESVEVAKQQLLGLAKHLGLSDATRVSYLAMLLQNRGAGHEPAS